MGLALALATFLATNRCCLRQRRRGGARRYSWNDACPPRDGYSYSAGNGAASYYGAPGCRRSHENYASQFTRAVAAAPYSQPADLNNVACSGALTSAFFSKTSGRPPQIDTVNHRYSLIFLTIGGNDLHFSDIVQYCLVAKTRDGANCGPNLARAQRLLDDGTMTQGLTHVLRAIHQAASSHAKIVLLGYPFLESDLQYTLRSGHGRHTFIAVGEKLHRVEADGNAVQQQVVKDLNASLHAHQFVFVDTEPLFAGTQPGFLGPNHELSATDVNPNRWFIQPFIDADRGPGTVDAVTGKDVFYHPNLAGWTAEAKLLLKDPEVPKHNLIAPAPSASASGTVSVSVTGPADNQFFSAKLNGRPIPESLSDSIARFGQPTSEQRYGPDGGVNCRVTWPDEHITGTFTVAYSGINDGCVPGSGTMVLTLGDGWKTKTGLAVGQSVADLRRVYPNAAAKGNNWTLVRYFYGAGYYITELGAVVSHGTISDLTVAGVPDE